MTHNICSTNANSSTDLDFTLLSTHQTHQNQNQFNYIRSWIPNFLPSNGLKTLNVCYSIFLLQQNTSSTITGEYFFNYSAPFLAENQPVYDRKLLKFA